MVSLMRSPSYCAHPIGDLTILPQDRYSPYIEQGERFFQMKLVFGKQTVSDGIAAQTYNEKPVVLSFFPSGSASSACDKAPILSLDSDCVLLSSFKKAEKGKGYIIRLFNTKNSAASCRLQCNALNVDQNLDFGAFEVKTFYILEGRLIECNMMEELP